MRSSRLTNALLLWALTIIAACANRDSPVAPEAPAALRSEREARPAPTQVVRIPVDVTTVHGHCGFYVHRRDTGTLSLVRRFDANGNLVLENALYTGWTITLTNPATGASVRSTNSGHLEQYKQFNDGSLVLALAGLVYRIVIPGQGIVAANVGVIRLRVVFDASGRPHVDWILIGGIHAGEQLEQLVCPYLAG